MVLPPGVLELTEILLPIIRHRIERLGIEESGAYGYYRARTADQVVFSNYEIALLRELLRRQLPVSEIHEIGCGYGQFVFLLGWNGFRTIGFEADPRRHRTAAALAAALAAADPAASALSRVLMTQFPPIDQEQDTSEALVISTNLAAYATIEVQREVAAAMRAYCYALIDVDRFFVSDPTASQSDRTQVFEILSDVGFTVCEPFLDLGNSGCYYLLGGGLQSEHDHSSRMDKFLEPLRKDVESVESVVIRYVV